MLCYIVFSRQTGKREDVAVIVGGEGYFRRIADVARVAEVGRIRADGRCLSRSVGRRQPFLADAGHIRRAGLFVRFFDRLFVPPRDDPDDFYDGDGLFRDS